jgi:hypothetical protein
MEPVDPTIDIGLGPSQVLRPGSGNALPGQAGGGWFWFWTEHWILLPRQSFLFKPSLPILGTTKNQSFKPFHFYDINNEIEIKVFNKTIRC